MDALIIDGPARLSGKVQISGSKNTALPLLFSSLLFDKPISFSNVPRLWDVETTLKLLESMGARYEWNKEACTVSIDPTVKEKVAPYEWVRKMRAGILALGPLVAKYGEAKVSLPGGCAIGARPVNFHIEALKKMGASVEVEEGYIKASVLKNLRGAEIEFPDVSVTGTENVLAWACFAEGKTILENAAREPEVVALGEFLQSCGAKIQGLGTKRIEIEGTKLTAPTKPVAVPADRIETGTWISIAVGTQSPLTLLGTRAHELTSVLDKYREMGVKFEIPSSNDSIHVVPTDKLLPVEVDTQPYPKFPTDMQAQILTNLCLAHGRSVVRENIFENRFMHVAELRRLGAKISTHENVAVIEGPVEFRGAPMMATDLRASACLVVAALSAKGKSRVSRIYHLDRGYQRLDTKLVSLGAQIVRVAE